jgi:dUTP pyrophosphatase
MNRYFEKVSFDQYKKDIDASFENYQLYSLPKRSTEKSAGYDFFMLQDLLIMPGDTVKIPTGVKVKLKDNEVLLIAIRSSLGYKYDLILSNQIGVIDSDYYGNIDNEGHIFIPIKNSGNNKYIFKQGDKFAQGIFINYLTVDNEEKITSKRSGGFGSTNKEG